MKLRYYLQTNMTMANIIILISVMLVIGILSPVTIAETFEQDSSNDKESNKPPKIRAGEIIGFIFAGITIVAVFVYIIISKTIFQQLPPLYRNQN